MSNMTQFGYLYTQVNLFGKTCLQQKQNVFFRNNKKYNYLRTIGERNEYTENSLCERNCNETHKKTVSMLVDRHRDGMIELNCIYTSFIFAIS